MKNKLSFCMNYFKLKASVLMVFMALVPHTLIFSQTNNDCGQAVVTNAWFEKHPELKAKYDAIQMQKLQQLNSNSGKKSINSIPSYTIPLVFHILHLGGSENISDAQVMDQVAILNRDYQKQNADTALIAPTFTNNIANVGFAFKLASIDPNGNCTNGIVRHYTYKTNWDANNLNDFTFSWPTDKYLNVYVVRSININATAYAFLPGVGVPPDADVIVAMHNMIGSMGTASIANSRVLTHEVAHWFDIQHIWGISNAPGVACGDDLVNDTPVTKGFSTCNTSASNVCDPLIFENVQNYMDYSPCKIMFTNGQAARMISTINSSINNRNNISSASNLVLTGLTGTNACSTLADFYVTKNYNCVGNTFTFTSLSQFGASGGTLQWSFPGGVPSSSTNSVVTVTYATPGTYTVSLTASGANGVDVETKNAYVNVYNGFNGLSLPFSYDFESSALPSSLTVINSESDTVLWKLNSSLGANGTNKCIYINNYLDSTNYGNRDYFETPYFDFTGTTALSFSYYYAYAKRYATQADSFKVQYSLDCGGSWTSLTGIPSITAMAVNSGGTLTTSFVPTSTQWKLVNLPSGLLSVLDNKPSVKFRFFFKSDYYVNGSNNIYIDQINITSSTITSLNDIEKSMQLSIYPNPTNTSTLVEFTSPNNSTGNIFVYDVTGRTVENEPLSVNAGVVNKVMLNKAAQLTPGIYFVTVDICNQKITRKLIIN